MHNVLCAPLGLTSCPQALTPPSLSFSQSLSSLSFLPHSLTPQTKHNQHHATPNKMTEDHQATDPDIDTVPLIAWHETLMKQVRTDIRLELLSFV